MGVRGLWKLLEPAAEEVDLESLRGKTIAVDASIWMHQFSKAVRDQEGAPIQGAALLGFCRRICKLLYYGVKPVFVFDGSGPRIKKLTLGVRMRRREAARKNEMEANMKLTSKRLRHHIISKLQNLDENKKAKIADTGEVFFRKSSKKHDIDYYDLPAERSTLQSHIQEVAEDPRLITRREVEQGITEYLNLNDVSMELDLDSEHFKSLPIQTQYDLITEIKEKSRESSKKRSQKMISLSADPMAFSNLQIKYLLRRNEIAERLSILNRMPVDDGSPSDKQLPMLKGLRVAGRRNREYFLFKDKPQHTRKSSPDAESRSDSPQTPGYACQEEGFTISRYQYSHELEQDFNYSSSYVPPKTPPPASARNDAFLDYLEQQPSEDDGVSPDSYTDLTPKSSHSELSSYSHNSCGSSEKV